MHNNILTLVWCCSIVTEMAYYEGESGLEYTNEGCLDINCPFFHFGFGDESTVEEYLARVTPMIVDKMEYRRMAFMELPRIHR